MQRPTSPRRTKTESRWLKVLSTLNEFQARLYVADKAIDLGRGGIRYLSALTGMSRTTITKAVGELQKGRKLPVPPGGGARQPGGGRKKAEQVDPQLCRELTRLVEESTAGDPMSLLRWTSKSTRTLATELTRRGHPIQSDTVARLLKKLDYRLQLNVKSKEGRQHRDRDRQFRYLHRLQKSSGGAATR
jgi:hypothetical protein